MKKIFIIFLSGIIFKAITQSMPCCAPPEVANVVRPNILIVWDITGSMRWRATWTGQSVQDPNWDNEWVGGGAYDPNKIYYGYFHPDSIYQYRSNIWKAVPNIAYTDHSITPEKFDFNNDKYLGNVLNWGTMSRFDVAIKALTGGKGQPAGQVNKNTLEGFGDNYGYRAWPTLSIKVGNRTYRFEKPSTDKFSIKCKETNNSKTYFCKVDVSKVPLEYKIGVIPQIADTNADNAWDENSPRFGLMTFTTGQNPYAQVVKYLHDAENPPDMEDFLNAINNVTPKGSTPVGDAVLEAIHYYRYCSPHWSGAYQWNINQVGTHKDPWFTGNPSNPQSAWCRKSFIILIGDGESNSDRPVSSDWAHLPQGPFPGRSLCDYYTGTEKAYLGGDCCSGCDDPADDYAYYAHITDLRPDDEPRYGLPCPQNLTFYTLFCFGSEVQGGEELFQDIACFGGFEDKNNNLIPDGYPNVSNDEWDKDGNLIPDNYYEAQTGHEIERAMREIIYRIIAGATSATAMSIVSGTAKGEGIGTFALYYPRRLVGGRFLTWLGEVKGLWVDKFGLLREETESNLTLHLKNDYVISFASAETGDICNPAGTMTIYKYKGVNCERDTFELVGQSSFDDLNALWDGGKWLWNATPGERNIKTWVDLNNNRIIESSEIIDFSISNKNLIFPYLDVPSIHFAESLINYIRGVDYLKWRDRKIDGKVWKLGDIVYSSPLFVQRPMERYDLLYLDADYKEFYNAYKDRRGVVYVGANDGMVHVFNVGRVVPQNLEACVPALLDPMGIPPGKEIWAYIPFNLLPHLKWLKDPDYCHVYYVDLKPYPTDAKIFTPDDIHVGGFGTLLIGSARLGGSPYNLSGNILSSSYFCIDVTEPTNPSFLWEKNLPDYSYTVPYPNVVKVGEKWFLVCGSGPKTCSGFSDQNAKIYILDLKTGDILKTFTVPEANSSIGDIISVDLGLDYTVDLIYFGTYSYTGTQTNPNFNGRIYRIKTHGDENPNNWSLSTVMDLGRPITSAGGATLDEYGNLWIYFGTGRLFYDGDKGDIERQVFVGIKDDTVSTYTYADLFNVTNVIVYDDGTVKIGNSEYTWEQFVDMVSAKKGWYRELVSTGERTLFRPLIIGGAVVFTTYAPISGDICQFGGTGRLYALYYITGTAYKSPILGVQGNIILPSIELGGGIPSEPTMWIGASEEKVFIQIKGKPEGLNITLPHNPRGGLILWKGR